LAERLSIYIYMDLSLILERSASNSLNAHASRPPPPATDDFYSAPRVVFFQSPVNR